MLRGAPDMSKYLLLLPKNPGEKTDIKSPLTKVKGILCLAGKANQELIQFSRNLIKPFLPSQFAILTYLRDDWPPFLMLQNFYRKKTKQSLFQRVKLKFRGKGNAHKLSRRCQIIRGPQIMGKS